MKILGILVEHNGQHFIEKVPEAWTAYVLPNPEDVALPLHEMSARAANVLVHAGIKTYGDACARSEGDLLRLPNFGRRSLAELRALLFEKGLTFKLE